MYSGFNGVLSTFLHPVFNGVLSTLGYIDVPWLQWSRPVKSQPLCMWHPFVSFLTLSYAQLDLTQSHSGSLLKWKRCGFRKLDALAWVPGHVGLGWDFSSSPTCSNTCWLRPTSASRLNIDYHFWLLKLLVKSFWAITRSWALKQRRRKMLEVGGPGSCFRRLWSLSYIRSTQLVSGQLRM